MAKNNSIIPDENIINQKIIIEIRHNPVWEIMDNHGSLLRKMFELIPDQFSNMTQEGKSTFLEKKNDINSNITTLRLELDSLNYNTQLTVEPEMFLENFLQYFKCFYNHGPEINQINRLGYRTINIYKTREDDFEHVVMRLNSKIVSSDLDRLLNTKDLQFTSTHKTGRVLVGPIKENDPWVYKHFNPDKELIIDKFGFAIDNDSFVTNVKINKYSDIESEVRKLFTKGINLNNKIFNYLY